jgi:hypothetical protein
MSIVKKPLQFYNKDLDFYTLGKTKPKYLDIPFFISYIFN